MQFGNPAQRQRFSRPLKAVLFQYVTIRFHPSASLCSSSLSCPLSHGRPIPPSICHSGLMAATLIPPPPRSGDVSLNSQSRHRRTAPTDFHVTLSLISHTIIVLRADIRTYCLQTGQLSPPPSPSALLLHFNLLLTALHSVTVSLLLSCC